MLYWLTEFSDGGDVFNLFRYITFRAGCAFATALPISMRRPPPRPLARPTLPTGGRVCRLTI